MKKLLFLAILVIVPFGVKAQSMTNVKRVEFEIGAGFTKGHKIYDGTSNIGLQLFFETRLNITDTPFDIGFQTLLGYFDRTTDFYERDNTIRHRGLMATFVDYNYRWQKVALFGGLGLGFSAVNHEVRWDDQSTGGLDSDTIFGRTFLLNPRIGIELFNHIRFTLEYKLMKREYSYFGLSLGGVFGGGYKK